MNVLNGNVPETGLLKGSISTIYGKDGKNAYEVACMNGFEGTMEEWLASLKGDKGDHGIYIGSGEMPENCYVQIDPNGVAFEENEDLNRFALWTPGSFSKGTGGVSTGTFNSTLITKDFVSAAVGKVYAGTNYHFSVYAYDNKSSAYKGVWTGDSFVVRDSATEAYVDSFTLSDYEDYKFKIKAKNTAGNSFDKLGGGDAVKGQEKICNGIHLVSRIYQTIAEATASLNVQIEDTNRVIKLNGLKTGEVVPEFSAGLMNYTNGEFSVTNNAYNDKYACCTPVDVLYDIKKGTNMYVEHSEGTMSVFYSTDGGVTFTTYSGRSWVVPADCKAKIRLLRANAKDTSINAVETFPQTFVVKTPDVVEYARFNSCPIVTFIDDDCLDEALDNWEVISDETGVKPTVAVVTSVIGLDAPRYNGSKKLKYPGWDKVKRLWCKGFEFISHTHGYVDHEKYGTGHQSLTKLYTEESPAEAESQLAESVKKFHENGINPRFLAYPGNQTDGDVIKLVKKYFVGAVMGENVINHPPLEPFRLFRVSFNMDSKDPDYKEKEVEVEYYTGHKETCAGYYDIDHMKSVINEAVATNGWVIFMSHIRNQGGFYYTDTDGKKDSAGKDLGNVKALIVETIKYAAEKGCEILTLGEAYDKIRNRMTCAEFVIDCDGAKRI